MRPTRCTLHSRQSPLSFKTSSVRCATPSLTRASSTAPTIAAASSMPPPSSRAGVLPAASAHLVVRTLRNPPGRPRLRQGPRPRRRLALQPLLCPFLPAEAPGRHPPARLRTGPVPLPRLPGGACARQQPLPGAGPARGRWQHLLGHSEDAACPLSTEGAARASNRCAFRPSRALGGGSGWLRIRSVRQFPTLPATKRRASSRQVSGFSVTQN